MELLESRIALSIDTPAAGQLGLPYAASSPIDLSRPSVLGYGGRLEYQAGHAELLEGGLGLRLRGNTWQALPFRYEVTPHTRLAFDFLGLEEGELQGIGVDTDLRLSSQDAWFALQGTDPSFGIRDYASQGGPNELHYDLPLGEYFTGATKYLTFGNDQDAADPTAESIFSNVRLYERETVVEGPLISGEAAALSQAQPTGPTLQYDIVVYGATPAGITTAVQAARMGKSVVVLEPGRHVGGMLASGLGLTDVDFEYAVGGLSREFFERIKTYYDNPSAWTLQSSRDYDAYHPQADTMWRFEPHVAEAVFEDWLDDEFVPVIRGERLDRALGVTKVGERIASITMESQTTYVGQMFVDAGYEGDLMALSGVSYVVGRESRDTYGESLAGVYTTTPSADHFQSIHPVDPYVVPGDPSSGLIRGVHASSLAPEGSADDKVQSYNFRMVLTREPANRVPFIRPASYDERDYELLFRYYEAGNTAWPFSFHFMPNLKTDSNGASAFSSDFIGENHDYPEANYEEREAIVRAHRDYQQGLLWTMANHPRIPQYMRNTFASWGLPANEFEDNGNWPFQLYVREARRMVSDYVQTQGDSVRSRIAQDSVGLASYPTDSHFVQRYVADDGTVRGEGLFYARTGGPSVISYRSIIPRVGEAENLLVPVGMSASHVAFGGIRLEPTYMILGQSAGTAAALAIDRGGSVQNLDYEGLRNRLEADGQVLDLPLGLAPVADIADVEARHVPVSTMAIVFSEPVRGFDLSDLSLTLNGGPNLLSNGQRLSSPDGGRTWTLDNLAGLTTAGGQYVLRLAAASAGITDLSGNAVGANASEAWTMTIDSLAFDFGTSTSLVESGYLQVTDRTAYNPSLGYGWLSGVITSRDRGVGSDLFRDLNFTSQGTFVADVANGRYQVAVSIGDSGPFRRDQQGVLLEGVLRGTLTTAGGEVVTESYEVDVNDGELTLTLQDLGGDPYVMIAALRVTADRVAPTVAIVDVNPDPRLSGVSSIDIQFSEPVTGVDIADLELTRNRGPNLLDASQTLTSADGGRTWTLSNLLGLTDSSGRYAISLRGEASEIVDLNKNALLAGALAGWDRIDLLAGDANLDGQVNLADFAIVRARFGAAGTWTKGDFDLDGRVSLSDFASLKANFGKSSMKILGDYNADGRVDLVDFALVKEFVTSGRPM